MINNYQDAQESMNREIDFLEGFVKAGLVTGPQATQAIFSMSRGDRAGNRYTPAALDYTPVAGRTLPVVSKVAIA